MSPRQLRSVLVAAAALVLAAPGPVASAATEDRLVVWVDGGALNVAPYDGDAPDKVNWIDITRSGADLVVTDHCAADGPDLEDRCGADPTRWADGLDADTTKGCAQTTAVVVTCAGTAEGGSAVNTIEVDLYPGDDVFGGRNATAPTLIDDTITQTIAVRGGDGDDDLNTGKAGDQLLGGRGDDSLSGGRGDDAMNGNEGRNEVSYFYTGANVKVEVSSSGNGVAGENDTIANAQDLTGGDGDDQLQGGTGDNTLDGGKGNDTIRGSTGADTLLGGEGNDVLASRDDTKDTDDCGPGTDKVTADNTLDAFVECEAIDPQVAVPASFAGNPGAVTEGDVLTLEGGTFNGTPGPVRRDWRRCNPDGTGCVEIRGTQDVTSYTTTSADVGRQITVHVRTTNAAGSAATDTPRTGTVAAKPAPPPPPPPPPPPASAGGFGTAKPAKLSVGGSRITVDTGLTAACDVAGPACTLTVAATANRPRRRRARASAPLGAGTARSTVQPGASAKVTFRLSRAAARLLRSRRKLKITVVVRIEKAGAPTATKRRTITVRLPRRSRGA